MTEQSLLQFRRLAQGVKMIRQSLEETFGGSILPNTEQVETPLQECELIAQAIYGLRPVAALDDNLYTAINNVVEQRLAEALATDMTINLPDWVNDVVNSLADMIALAEPGEQEDGIVDFAIERLRELVPQKRRELERER
jgi:hypothetical protein